jgi:site-specific recombinase XerD
MENSRIYLSFFLYKSRKNKNGTPVYLKISLPNESGQLHTGITVDEKHWNQQKYQLRENKPAHKELNKQLSIFKCNVLAIFTEYQEKDLPVSIEVIKHRMSGENDGEVRTLLEAFKLHNDQLRVKLGIESTRATVAKYESLLRKVTRYIEHQYKRKNIFLKELDHRFIVNFEIFLKTVDGIAHNSAIKYIQFFKKITNMSIAHGWLDKNPFQNFKCSLKEVHRGFLSRDELSKLQAKEIQNQRLSDVRDIFVFSCYTGLAYTDVKALTQNGVVKGVDGNNWVNSSRKKTGVRISVPLLTQAQFILNKHIPGKNGCLLPVLSNQKVNAYLKEIGDICGIEKNLTFHLARHTFATTVTLSNGVPIETVSKMLGHTNLKTTQIYAKVVDTKISNDMQALQGKLQ